MQWIKETDVMTSTNDNSKRKRGNFIYKATFYVGAILVFGYIGIHLVPAQYNEYLLRKCIKSPVAKETCDAEALNRRQAHIEWLKKLGFNPTLNFTEVW